MKKKEEWTKDVKMEDLPESCQQLAQVIGVEETALLMQECGGTYLYIPKSDSLMRLTRDRAILKKYNQGVPVRTIALQHALTESRVRAILFERGNPDQMTIDEIQQA